MLREFDGYKIKCDKTIKQMREENEEANEEIAMLRTRITELRQQQSQNQ